MNNKLLALYGLKWSPFSPEVPTEALYVSPRVESFCWRVEQLASEGGFGLVTGDVGARQIGDAAHSCRAACGAARCQGGGVHPTAGRTR